MQMNASHKTNIHEFTNLSYNECLIAQHIVYYGIKAWTYCRKTQKTISNELGLGLRTVERCIQKLKAANLIKVKRQGRNPSHTTPTPTLVDQVKKFFNWGGGTMAERNTPIPIYKKEKRQTKGLIDYVKSLAEFGNVSSDCKKAAIKEAETAIQKNIPIKSPVRLATHLLGKHTRVGKVKDKKRQERLISHPSHHIYEPPPELPKLLQDELHRKALKEIEDFEKRSCKPKSMAEILEEKLRKLNPSLAEGMFKPPD